MASRMERRGGSVILRTPVLRTALMALGSLGFVVAGALILAASLAGSIEAYRQGSTMFAISLVVASFYLILGLASVLFFGYALVFLSIRLVSRAFGDGILLEIGPDGFVDHASAIGAGFVPWKEVSSVRFQSVAGQRFLVIKVKDGDALLERLNPFKRAIVRLNRWRYTGGEVSIPVAHIGVTEGELGREMSEARRRFEAGRGRV